jgi:hypothetical protein
VQIAGGTGESSGAARFFALLYPKNGIVPRADLCYTESGSQTMVRRVLRFLQGKTERQVYR